MTFRRQRLLAFLLPSAFCLLAVSAYAQPLGPAAGILPRTATGGVPGPPSVPVNPRRAVAFGTAIVGGLLLLQYAHRRKPFILVCAVGWLFIAPQMLLIARGYDSVTVARSAVGLSQLLGICTAAAFAWSADVYRHTRYVRGALWKPLAGIAAWFLLAPQVFGIVSVLSPGYILSALLMGAGGTMYAAVVIERNMVGAGLVAFVLFGLAVSDLTAAFVAPQMLATGRYTFEILLANGVLYAFAALGIHQLVFEDMTYELRITNHRLETARQELLQAAITDPLTGCHNRRFLEQVMERELRRHDRFELPLSLLFIDIDRFKQINDTLGHEAGDRVLQHVARFLKRHIREADYVFRWGGDEFLVLITCDGVEAQRKARALKAAFDAAPQAVELPPGIGLSVGWTEVPARTTNLIPLVSEADERMYEDKGKRA